MQPLKQLSLNCARWTNLVYHHSRFNMKLEINIFWVGIQAVWLQPISASFAKETDFVQQLKGGGVDLILEILFFPRKYLKEKKWKEVQNVKEY